MASGSYSTALGVNSVAGGNSSTAIGNNSSAGGANSTAVGVNSMAGFTNSTAIGYGATTTRNNQMTLGTATNTYTAPGITSAASLAAQAGPTQIVTSDGAGNLATTSANAVVNSSSTFQDLKHTVNRDTEGVAMAIALGAGGAVLPDCTCRAVTIECGDFDGANAVGISGIQRLGDHLFMNGAVGIGCDYGSVGGRVGVTYAW